MENNQEKNTDSTKCELPQTRSISEIVHEHLKNKNDHISDADIKNAAINPDENELEIKNENVSEGDPETDGLNKKKEENKIVTPWDVVDKNALE